MSAASTNRVVLLTPGGRGAVASLLVEGPGAVTAVAGAFYPARGRALAEVALDQIVFGRWESVEHGEEVVVCRRSASRVEIHCHGGRVAADAILASLVARGCQPVDWRAWIEQSQDDPIRAAALIAITSAATERTAAVLWDQQAGALRHALDEIGRLVSRCESAAAVHLIDELLAVANVGLHLLRPWRVVLAGPPNVGKSSLVNALLGYARAIVHDAPGTTRDVVATVTALDGWPIELADTAGLHTSKEPIEISGMALAKHRLAQADLIVWVCDGSLPRSLADEMLSAAWPRALNVWNKCDLLANRGEGRWTSAATGEGIAALAAAIVDCLIPRPPEPGQAVPFLPQQVEQLRLAREALAASDATSAARHLELLAPPADGAC